MSWSIPPRNDTVLPARIMPIITEYPEHPINQDFSTVTLFPQAAGIERLPAFIDDVRNADETGTDISSDQENDSSTSLNSNFTMLPFSGNCRTQLD